MKSKIIIATALLIIVFAATYHFGLSKTSTTDGDEVSLLDYFPTTEMVKVFNGGYENEGTIHYVSQVTEEQVEIIQVDTGAGVALVYRITPDEIALIYASEIGDDGMKQDYLNVTSNEESIVLKGPVRKGTKWNNDGTSYKITDINKKVTTPAGTFETIVVTSKRDDFEVTRYYGKNIGLVKTDVLGYDSELIEVDYDVEKVKEIDQLFELLNIYLFK